MEISEIYSDVDMHRIGLQKPPLMLHFPTQSKMSSVVCVHILMPPELSVSQRYRRLRTVLMYLGYSWDHTQPSYTESDQLVHLPGLAAVLQDSDGGLSILGRCQGSNLEAPVCSTSEVLPFPEIIQLE